MHSFSGNDMLGRCLVIVVKSAQALHLPFWDLVCPSGGLIWHPLSPPLCCRYFDRERGQSTWSTLHIQATYLPIQYLVYTPQEYPIAHDIRALDRLHP